LVKGVSLSLVQVCDEKIHCPMTETSPGGEDEDDCIEGCGDGPVDQHDWCYDTLTVFCKCTIGWAGDGQECGRDTDLDGSPDQNLKCADELLTRINFIGDGDARNCLKDNCPAVPNSGQEDQDGDGIGDACDNDKDNDGVHNNRDNCPLDANSDQRDTDRDGVGDVCDKCPNFPDTVDTDNDGIDDACDDDKDGDGIINNEDNCEFISNKDQNDSDNDKLGDVCDNCPNTNNPDQNDKDQDQIGNACDTPEDEDKDGIPDSLDNCRSDANTDQLDTDDDGEGDICDNDIDGDNIVNDKDNCFIVYNPGQEDENGEVNQSCLLFAQAMEKEMRARMMRMEMALSTF